jgi:hypothetical protein
MGAKTMEQKLVELQTDACQIRATFAVREPVSRVVRRFFFDVVRRGTRLARGAKGCPSRQETLLSQDRNDAVHEFREGELVRVKSLDDIRSTLDTSGRTGGCKFTKPMVRYCEREFRIARRMTKFFDEAQWKMVKCKKLLLLDGSYCDGSGGPSTQGCDRMCFVFWREEWLEPVE